MSQHDPSSIARDKRDWTLVATVVAASLVLLLVVNLGFIPRVRRQIPRQLGEALTEAGRLRLALLAYEDDYGSFPVCGGIGDATQDVRALLALLKRAGYIERMGQDEKSEGLDPWGREYNARLDTHNDGFVRLGRGKVVNDRVAIWSCGKNGINEWGEGDDVCRWNEPRAK